MAGIRYGYQRSMQPPAPFINVVLQHSSLRHKQGGPSPMYAACG